MEIRKAQKQKAKLRVGLSGPSGSGKTYSALLLASGLTSLDKVVIIDTENGSADLYDNLGDYNVLQLEAPYNPERYVEAIESVEKEGYEVIIIDSISHEWEGKGGCLEINETLGKTKYKGNSWAAWNETTPRHQKFLEKIVTSKCHVITAARSKTDTIQTEDRKIKKVGTKEIQREGFEYELTLNFNLDRDGNLATASKDRTGIFINRDPFKITKSIGEELKKWSETGVELKIKQQQIDPVEVFITKLSEKQTEEEISESYGKFENYIEDKSLVLTPEQQEEILDAINTRKDEINEELDIEKIDAAIEKKVEIIKDEIPLKKYVDKFKNCKSIEEIAIVEKEFEKEKETKSISKAFENVIERTKTARTNLLIKEQ